MADRQSEPVRLPVNGGLPVCGELLEGRRGFEKVYGRNPHAISRLLEVLVGLDSVVHDGPCNEYGDPLPEEVVIEAIRGVEAVIRYVDRAFPGWRKPHNSWPLPHIPEEVYPYEPWDHLTSRVDDIIGIQSHET